MDFRKDAVEKFYDFLEELGRGQFAVVNLCVNKVTGEKFAAKRIQKKVSGLISSTKGVEMRTIRQEVAILAGLEHENVVRLFHVFESRSTVTLVLEYVEGGELFALVSERERLDEDEASGYVRQLLAGVAYLHESEIAHLDLKPENIMLEHAGSGNAQVVKIIDFGLAQRILKGKPISIEPHGTAEFIPPEVLACEPVSTSADLWMIGVIIFVLLSGLSPFASDNDGATFARILAAQYTFYDEPFGSVTDLAKDLIYKLIQRKPTDRLTAEQALAHPWINPLSTEQRLLRKRSKVKRENLLRLKRYVTPRARWKQTVGVIKVVNRLARSRRAHSQGAIDAANLNSVGGQKETATTQPYATLPGKMQTSCTMTFVTSASTSKSSTASNAPNGAPAQRAGKNATQSGAAEPQKRTGALNTALLNIRSLLKPVSSSKQNK